jgi:hypothetical protein
MMHPQHQVVQQQQQQHQQQNQQPQQHQPPPQQQQQQQQPHHQGFWGNAPDNSGGVFVSPYREIGQGNVQVTSYQQARGKRGISKIFLFSPLPGYGAHAGNSPAAGGRPKPDHAQADRHDGLLKCGIDVEFMKRGQPDLGPDATIVVLFLAPPLPNF